MKIVVYTKPNCTECERIKFELKDKDMQFDYIDMEELEMSEQFALRTDARKNRQMSMPLIYVDGKFTTTVDFEEQYL